MSKKRNNVKKPYIDEPKNRSKSWEDRESKDMRKDERSRKYDYFKNNMRGKDKETTNDIHQTSHNDASAYTGNGQLAKDLGNLNFNYQTGLPTGQGDIVVSNGTTSTKYVNSFNVIPGVMRINFIPTYGYMADGNSAVNYAAQKNYTAIRYKNSGGANYDPVDLQMYYLGMDSPYMYIAWLSRLYRISRTYSPYNRYYPFAVMEAMGINNPKLVTSNLSRFRAVINSLVPMINSLKVPATMPIFTRHSWMCNHIYMDANVPRAQSYVYNPVFLYQYSEQNGTLTPYDFLAKLNSATTPDALYDAMYQVGLDLFQPLFNSQSVGNMSGDVERAFDSGVITVSVVTEDEAQDPVYDPEVLNQIHNAMAWTDTTEDHSGFIITLDRTNNIMTQTGVALSPNSSVRMTSTSDFKLMIDIRNNEPSVDDVIVGSRLMSYPTIYVGNQTTVAKHPTFGSEIITSFRIYDLNSDMTATSGVEFSSFQISSTNAAVLGSNWGLISKFDWAPRLYAMLGGSSTSNGDLYWNGDIDNYSFIPYEYLDEMHRMAMLSLLGITDK